MVHLGDICKINGAEIESVWCITGGSPCQDLSIAGKRAGLAGARSGLFMEQVRIVKEMREADKRNGRTGNMVRPRFLVWENVVGAFSSNRGKDFHAVLEEIARIAEPGFSLSGLPEKWKWTKAGAIDGDGWSIAWRTHDAKDWGKTIRDSRTGNVIRLGTPQRRRRISVVADFGGESAAQIQFDRESVSGDIAESREAGEGPAGASESGASYAVRIRGGGGCDGGGKGALVQTEKSGTLGTGNDQTIFCLQGNGIDRADTAGCNGKGWREDACYTLNTIDRPAVCAEVRCLTPWDAQSQRVYDGNGVSPTLSSRENSGLNREAVLCAGFKTGQGAQAHSIGYEEETSPTLSANAHVPCVALDMTHACDVIRECGEQVPALQARMGTGGNQVPLTYGIGNGQANEAGIMAEEVSQTLNTMHDAQAVMCEDVSHALRAKANCAYREDAETYPVQNMVVRRLTPLECTRLQGYPDGWVDIGDWTDEKGKKHKDADSPKYKALGNSIALPFWDWMLRRMARYLPEGATLGSLFDGISGFNVCWARIHGAQCCRWSSEIEQFPIAVVKKHFGDEEAGKEGDFEKFFGRNKKENV